MIDSINIDAVTDEELAEIMPMVYKMELEHIKNDKIYFINNYVWIEDLDSPTGMVDMKLWPEQENAIRSWSENRKNIILKAPRGHRKS